MHMKSMLIIILLHLAPTIHAQPIVDHDRIPEPWIEIIGDVNGDGMDDRLRSTPLNEYVDVITIEIGKGYFFHDVPDYMVAIPTNHSDFEGLEHTSDTTFTIQTGCFACGRYHSWVEYKIAYRNDDFLVAGFTMLEVDRLSATMISCDVNLLTGQAEVAFEGGHDIQRVISDERAFPLQDLKARYSPQVCDLMDKYDEDYVQKYVIEREGEGAN